MSEPKATDALPSPALQRAQQARLDKAWETPKGWRYWSAVNNTEVGVWYIATAFFFFLFAGVLALVMRAQLAVPDNDLVSAEFYNQLFTMHGTAMMFLFAVPIFEAVAILLLPQMLCSRDLPFPRLSAYGFWCFIIGGLFVCGSLLFAAAPSGGWFMYPPLTTEERFSPGLGADIWLLGLSFIEVAALAAAVELIVGVLKCRPPGMRLNLMPLYAWYVLVVAVMILFAFPPLLAGDILFELERMADWPFFDPARGGDPLLWQHLFWIFGHPEVYIIFLPAIALVAMIVPTFAQRPIVGYTWIVLAAVGTGFLSFGLWVHHMYTTGLPAVSLGFFASASEAVALPTGVQIFVFIATLLAGRVIYSVPMLFVSGALAIFVLGGLTGVMVALVPFDWQAHDSYFVVAHLHYTLIGGMLFPVMAGLYYYAPLVLKRQLDGRSGRWAFWLMFIGFNITFLPMHLTGLLGMPRRVFTYPAGLGFDGLNMTSTIGAFVLAAGVLVVVWEVLRPARRAAPAPRNPWNAGTLEWVTPLPPPTCGVRSVPAIHTRYPLWEQPGLEERVDAGAYYLPDAEEGKRETLVTSVLDARPLQCLRVPGYGFMPMVCAICTAGLFIFATFHWWYAALASGIAAIGVALFWLWTGTAQLPEKAEKDVGCGVHLPLYMAGPKSVGWWAMFITMTGDGAAFASLVFALFYFWSIHGSLPPSGVEHLGLLWPSVATAALLLGWWLVWRSVNQLRAGRERAMRINVAAALLLALVGGGGWLAAPWAAGYQPTAHAYTATVWVIAIWTALHAAAGGIMLGYCLARSWAGRLFRGFDMDLQNVALYWHFLALTAAVTAMVLALAPRLL